MPAMFLAKEKTINKVVLIDPSFIYPNPAQPRKVFNELELTSLRDSILANGLLQPLTIRKISDRMYELIAGERRLRACQMAEMTQIPCIIVDVSDQQSAVYALIENIQRADLNFFEQALGIKTLMEEWGVTQQAAAKQLCMAQSTIANKLRLLRLTEADQQRIVKNGLTERHARALLRLDESQRSQALTVMIKKQMNVVQAEEYVEHLQKTDQPNQKATRFFAVKDVRIFVNTISKAIEVMKRAGIDANVTKQQNDEMIEYIVRIPVNSAQVKPI